MFGLLRSFSTSLKRCGTNKFLSLKDLTPEHITIYQRALDSSPRTPQDYINAWFAHLNADWLAYGPLSRSLFEKARTLDKRQVSRDSVWVEAKSVCLEGKGQSEDTPVLLCLTFMALARELIFFHFPSKSWRKPSNLIVNLTRSGTTINGRARIGDSWMMGRPRRC